MKNGEICATGQSNNLTGKMKKNSKETEKKNEKNTKKGDEGVENDV